MYDSGVGGLTVVRAVQEAMPNEDIIYLADTARVPYGDKSKDDIIQFSKQIMDFLIGHGCKLLIVACNTSSAIALPQVIKNIDIPVVGMITPGAAKAIRTTQNGKIGIIATNNTAKSGAYGCEIRKFMANAQVYEKGCPLLVPMIEAGEVSGDKVRNVIREYVDGMLSCKIDTLIYGCTHYPYLKDEIRNVVGGSIRLIDPALEVAEEVSKILKNKQNDLLSYADDKGKLKVFVTGDIDNFKQYAYKLIKREINDIVHLDLEDLITE